MDSDSGNDSDKLKLPSDWKRDPAAEENVERDLLNASLDGADEDRPQPRSLWSNKIETTSFLKDYRTGMFHIRQLQSHPMYSCFLTQSRFAQSFPERSNYDFKSCWIAVCAAKFLSP